MAKRKTTEANVYGSGLPKGRRLKSGEKVYSGGVCTRPPLVRTTDDLVQLVGGELRDLLEIATDVLAGDGDPDNRRDRVALALICDASRWCEAIADALESGKWPKLDVEDTAEAALLWADVAAEIAPIEEANHESVLSFCSRAVQAALPVKPEPAPAKPEAA